MIKVKLLYYNIGVGDGGQGAGEGHVPPTPEFGKTIFRAIIM